MATRASGEDVAFGRGLCRLLPEDDHDAQPLAGGEGRFLFVADLRLDNRDEVLAALGLSARRGRDLADADILLRGWERWSEGVLERLNGDYAIAIWDGRERRLTLARDPLGQRPLHFMRKPGCVAFASMPRALGALPGPFLELDARRLAEFAADMPLAGSTTFFENVERVEPGQILRVTAGGLERRSWWRPALKQARYGSFDQYVLAFREQLDRAVGARLRGTNGRVAAHLSSGWDSSAVTTTAARLLAPDGGRVIALTAAPRAGFDGLVAHGRVADESAYAADTASSFLNIDHHVVRPSEGRSLLDPLDRSHRAYQYPVSQVTNNAYWVGLHEEARRHGAGVTLNGGLGNLTISAGGLGLLADLVREGRILTWWREARATVRRGPARWRGALANSFGPWLPRPIWDQMRARFHGGSPRSSTPYLLHSQWADLIDNRVRLGRDARPAKDSYRLRRDLLTVSDWGTFRKGALGGWNIDERDPTADIRLVEFCLSLPPDLLLKNGLMRPLARAALADRVPQATLNLRVRGLQGADWYEQVGKAELADHVEATARSPLASSILNVERLRAMLANWPERDLNRNWVVEEYRRGFLQALSVSHFIRTNGGADA